MTMWTGVKGYKLVFKEPELMVDPEVTVWRNDRTGKFTVEFEDFNSEAPLDSPKKIRRLIKFLERVEALMLRSTK